MSVENPSTSAQPEKVPEPALTMELKDKVLQQGFEDYPPITSERKQEIEQELGDTAILLNDYGRPWFLAGGSALECAQGEITRDHQDTDVAMYYDDVGGFYEFATTKGYRFISVEGKDITSHEELLAQRENAFLKKGDEAQPGPQAFEIMFLRKNEAGEVIFSADERLGFPASVYENAPTYTAPNGQRVPLQPKDVSVLYKLFDGRHKDFLDVRKFYPTLTNDERQRVTTALTSLNTRFVADDSSATDNIDELLQHTETTTPQAKERFVQSGKVEEIAGQQAERLERINTIYGLSQHASSPEEFRKALEQQYGKEVVTRHKEQLDKMAGYLYQETRPTQDDFRVFAYQEFGIQEQMMRELKTEVLDMKRWEVRTE
jgi:hypothetical protein